MKKCNARKKALQSINSPLSKKDKAWQKKRKEMENGNSIPSGRRINY